jgi:hypothetical protein
MHFQYVRPGGLWGLFTLLTSAAVQLIDQQLFKAINGDDGGTWAPTSVITLGGAGVHVTGPLVADNLSGHVTSGNMLTVDVGAALNIAGVQNVLPAALVNVFGLPFTPGAIVIYDEAAIALASPATPGAMGGAFYAFPNSLTDFMGVVLFEYGSSWTMLGGSVGIVRPDALITLTGLSWNHAATTLFLAYSQAVFLPGSRAIFLNSDLILGSGSTLHLVNVINFSPGSLLVGTTTISDDAVVTVAGSSPAHPASIVIGVNGSINFLPGGVITGSPVITGPSRFDGPVEFNALVGLDAGRTLRLSPGSFFNNDGKTVRTGPEDRVGSQAVTGERQTMGADGPYTIDAEAWDWVTVPPQSHSNVVWTLAVPQNLDRAITVTVTAAVSALNNDLLVGWSGSNLPLVRFRDDSGSPPGSVVFGWDPTVRVWRIKSSTTVAIGGGAGSAISIPQ